VQRQERTVLNKPGIGLGRRGKEDRSENRGQFARVEAMGREKDQKGGQHDQRFPVFVVQVHHLFDEGLGAIRIVGRADEIEQEIFVDMNGEEGLAALD
jgi:hypothetical protein